jgi:amino acid adenylation domain-containing protein
VEPLTAFLMDLRRQGIVLSAEGDSLRFRAPKGAMTPAIRSALQQRKADILALVRGPEAARIPRAEQQDDYPTSHAQRRLWVLSQDESSAAYNVPLKLLVLGVLDVPAFSRALTGLIRRHESLRTIFLLRGTELRQAIRDHVADVTYVDLTGHPEPDREVDARARQEALEPFDLGEGPLLRVTLLKLETARHVLLLTVHHIVCDGWSLGVMVRDFSALYRAACSGGAADLPELPVQYRDFSCWHNRLFEPPAMDDHRRYWLEALRKPLPALNLTAGLPRPAVRTVNGAAVECRFPREVTERLHALCHARHTSLFIVLTAVVTVLLHRYTGDEDIILGCPVAGRFNPDLADQVGLYLNTIVLRNRVQNDQRFDDLLQSVKRTATEAYDHQIYPFDLLVDELDPARDAGRSPLFDVAIFLQANERAPQVRDGIEFHHLPNLVHATKFDLTFDFVERENGLHLGLEYNTDLFAGERVRRMSTHFEALVAGILTDPGQRVGLLPMMSPAERLDILARQERSSEPSLAGTVVNVFEAQVARSADATAVTFDGQSLTYGELNDRANQLARHLQSRGVGPEVPVGLCAARSLDLIVALLGVLKAGGFYVPLDPEYPTERLAFMTADSGIRCLLIQRSLDREEFAATVPRVYVDSEWADIGGHGRANPDTRITPDNIAYTIYTSGSTGQPKGVQISHASLLNLLVATSRAPGMHADDVLLAVTTMSFDIAALELFLPLITGAQVVIASAKVAADGVLLLRLLNDSGATVMQATPAGWQMLISAGWTGSPGLKILCGGEALPPALGAELRRRGASCWNLYGPTETTVWSAVDPLPPRDSPEDPETVDICIGRELRNTQLYVLDRWLQLVPAGVAGELHIGGEGLARGYFRQPALTAARFIPNPLGTGDRLYKTGDMAALRPDGRFQFLGRLDNQVKVRGYRIETGEIEAVLSGHPAVRQSAVAVRGDSTEDQQLVGYVVPKGPHTDLAGELRAFLQQRLPRYMVPAAFVVLDAMPLSPAGKIDRRALPARVGVSAPAFVAPRTATEQTIATVWRDLLRLEQVGLYDNFFELGGNSLKGTTAVALIARALGARVTITDLFRDPTVEGLARICDANIGLALPAIPRVADEQAMKPAGGRGHS